MRFGCRLQLGESASGRRHRPHGQDSQTGKVAPLLFHFHITYLGKRGSFLQLLAPPESVETPDDRPSEGFIPLVPWDQRARPLWAFSRSM